MRRQHHRSATRAEVAAHAARAMIDGSACDFSAARRRALRDLRVDGQGAVPDNLDIHREIVAYLDLFHRSEQTELIVTLRRAALRAMALLEAFEPRLCGPVWYGTAVVGTPISMHLFSDETEAVTRFLLEHKIDYRLTAAGFRFARGKAPRETPCFELALGDAMFELAVFPHHGRRQAPLSALDDKPMRRVGRAELERVIEAGILFPDERSRSL